MSKEIMQVALDALEDCYPFLHIDEVVNIRLKAIEALEAELAKPEQPQTENILYLLSAWERGAYAEEYANEIEALRQAIKEPDVTLTDEGKTWQGLTDEEIDSIESGISRVTFVRAIEARLKELNA